MTRSVQALLNPMQAQHTYTVPLQHAHTQTHTSRFALNMAAVVVYSICLLEYTCAFMRKFSNSKMKDVSICTVCLFVVGASTLSCTHLFPGNGRVVLISGGDANERKGETERSDFSRCDGRLKRYFKIPPRFLWFLLEARVKVHLFSIQRCFSFLGPVPVIKVCFHFSSGNSPHPAHCPKPSG